MSRPDLHIKYQVEQLARLDKTMAAMVKEGIPLTAMPFARVWDARARLQLSFGFRVPREVFALIKMYGFSPGTITLWLDTETGYMVEAREKPEAPPMYKAVSDEVAMAILKGEVTPELEKELMTPDEYWGE